jgi:hypothetical protein
LIDTGAIAWAITKLRAFGVAHSSMNNAMMVDRLEAMLQEPEPKPINADAQRYVHLRDGKSIYCEFAPCILNRSSMIKVKGKEADLLIDNDILDTKMAELDHDNEIVERDLLPEGVEVSCLDETYCKLLEEVALQDLQFSEERILAMKENNARII